MPNLIDQNALVLVAVLPSVRDYEIARLLGWYRIPLRMAPKIVSVDMLAFYQPGTFGEEHRWRIEHVAEVKGVELTTRAELLREEANHPRANEEYYKLSIGSLQGCSNRSLPTNGKGSLSFIPWAKDSPRQR